MKTIGVLMISLIAIFSVSTGVSGKEYVEDYCGALVKKEELNDAVHFHSGRYLIRQPYVSGYTSVFMNKVEEEDLMNGYKLVLKDMVRNNVDVRDFGKYNLEIVGLDIEVENTTGHAFMVGLDGSIYVYMRPNYLGGSFERTVVHELGHYIDYKYMGMEEWEEYRKFRNMENGYMRSNTYSTPWGERTKEVFAEDFVTVVEGSGNRTVKDTLNGSEQLIFSDIVYGFLGDELGLLETGHLIKEDKLDKFIDDLCLGEVDKEDPFLDSDKVIEEFRGVLGISKDNQLDEVERLKDRLVNRDYREEKENISGYVKEYSKQLSGGYLKREEVAYVVANRLGLVAEGYRNFLDIPDKSNYKDYINAVSSEGLIEGYGNGKFGYGEYISREEFMVVLSRYTSDLNVVGDYEVADRDKLKDWSEKGIDKVYRRGLVRGDGNGKFHPENKVTLVELLIILDRLELSEQAEKMWSEKGIMLLKEIEMIDVLSEVKYDGYRGRLEEKISE